jgi:hypothetical protein
LASTEAGDDLVALDEALNRLAAKEPAAAKVVPLRNLAGLTIDDTPLALDISVRACNRHWVYALA